MEYFELMQKSNIEPNNVTYTTLIHMYSKISMRKAVQIYRFMVRKGIKPTSTTNHIMLNAYAWIAEKKLIGLEKRKERKMQTNRENQYFNNRNNFRSQNNEKNE